MRREVKLHSGLLGRPPPLGAKPKDEAAGRQRPPHVCSIRQRCRCNARIHALAFLRGSGRTRMRNRQNGSQAFQAMAIPRHLHSEFCHLNLRQSLWRLERGGVTVLLGLSPIKQVRGPHASMIGTQSAKCIFWISIVRDYGPWLTRLWKTHHPVWFEQARGDM